MDDDPKEFDDEEIKELLRDALAEKLKDKKKLPKKHELKNALISTLGEFLACYRIIGYDLKGDPVNIISFKEPMEKSALDNAFIEEIGKFMATRSING